MKRSVTLILALCMVLALAACTEAYDPYAGTDADLTVYIKWVG